MQLVQSANENNLREEHLQMVIQEEQQEHDKFVEEEMINMQLSIKGSKLMKRSSGTARSSCS